MNLHGLASAAIGGVNPFVSALIRRSTGTYTTDTDGTRIPSYVEFPVMIQRQPITTGDVQKLDALNLQGVHSAIYVDGQYNAVVRSLGLGGDLVALDGQIFLVVAVLETWPDWSKLAVTLQ